MFYVNEADNHGCSAFMRYLKDDVLSILIHAYSDTCK